MRLKKIPGFVSPPSVNNFDLIRLLAALQVFAGHAFLFHLFRENAVSDILWFIPGVPVFFGMSGYGPLSVITIFCLTLKTGSCGYILRFGQR